jgi:predicted glycoside hydrolase/deacetylase ChbG (UPF0249 family)
MIVNLPGFNDAVARAGSHPALSLGLHLNLTSGKPLTAAPSLTRRETGLFYSLPVLIAHASLGRIDSTDVARECAAQLDRMIEFGISPTHLDSHRHVHAHPALWPVVLQVASSRGVSNVRVPIEPLSVNARNWKATLKKTGLLICTRIARRHVEGNVADHFLGLSLQDGRAFAPRLFALIPKLQEGTTELMTHPGYSDAGASEHDDYAHREEELRALCSREFRDGLQRCEIELTSFGNRTPPAPSAHQIAQDR